MNYFLFAAVPTGCDKDARDIWERVAERHEYLTVEQILEKSKAAGYELENDSIKSLQTENYEENLDNMVSRMGKYSGTVKIIDGQKVPHGFGRECHEDRIQEG